MKKLILFLSLIILTSCFSHVGIGTNSPKSDLDVNGNISFKVVNLNGGPSGSATVINDGYYLNLNPTPSNVEFILPDATMFPGRMYILRNISTTETAKIYSFGGSFYAGNSDTPTATPLNLTPNNSTKTIKIISDGTNWTYGPFGW